MTNIEVLLTDSCKLLDLTVMHFFTLGKMGYFHTIIEDANGEVYEFDIADWFTKFESPIDDDVIMDDFISRLKETVGMKG